MKNEKITALIVDDEANARLSLRGMLEENFKQVEIIGEAKDVPEAVQLINEINPQIVFLDIEMPGYSGLTLIDFFNKSKINFKIIFVTAYSEFAINAFELSAIDYILKPIRKEHIERALKKISPQNTHQIETLQDNIQFTSKNLNDQKIVLKTSEGLLIKKLDEIIYLKADGSYTHIHFINQQRITTTKRLNEYERLEIIGHFVRIHRSQIINLNHISKITKNDGGSVIMSNNDELSISNEKKQELLEKLNNEKF